MVSDTSTSYSHLPVMVHEICEFLQHFRLKRILDCTLGEGGHSEFFLENFSPDIFLTGIERDPEVYRISRHRLARFNEKIKLYNCSFSKIDEILSAQDEAAYFNVILFDIGISSYHIDRSGRGFSFMKREKLDMRFDPGSGFPASDVVNSCKKDELADIFFLYGEEHLSRRYASAVFDYRKKKKIETSFELGEIIKNAAPGRLKRGRIHPATRVFQALRIYVNHELEEFQTALEVSIRYLAPGGRLIVISYHSLEDRIVKTFFKGLSREDYKILTKRPLSPSLTEKRTNNRSRSAKMRVIERLE
ncbi:MAG TPA: 16S rRNA (cytosine(1402)-N(4))-methyltransferase RsmH [Firmicutes bacterium]|nr:16S rRNA (cytosine(1402)-N(4))-methyltransferase RsmH [Bacillota bacterium]